jgi:NAD(P)-dependent dehydrogenase (short-subunit alcohol dehydrogenase family)
MDKRRVVVVTGAGGTGCGRAIAARFGAGGAAVVVCDINEAGGHETVRIINGAGGRAAFFRADVRREFEVRDLALFAETTFGGFHVLINNASAPVYPKNLREG